MPRPTWRRVKKSALKEVKTQIGTIRITPQHIEKAIQYGAMVVAEHDVNKDGKLDGKEKKAIAMAIAESVGRYARRKWLPKILRWFRKRTVEMLTSWGVLKKHRN